MLRIELLGGLRLAADGGELAPPASRRGQELLAWLALHPGEHTRSRVAAVLRPDDGEEAARHTLRQALWAVRAAVGDVAADVLVVGRDVVGLAAGAAEVDVAVARARAEHGDAEAFAALRRPLVPALDAPWLDGLREEVHDAAMDLASRLSAAAEARGDLAGALRWARERADGDAASEPAQRELIRLLGATGDRAAALREADVLRRRLADELGVVPSAETRAVVDAVLADPPPAPAAPPAAPAVVLPPPVAAVADAPLVGRDDDLRALLVLWERVREGGTGVALVGGDPGVGKTRLTAELARRAHLDGALVLYGRCDAEALVPYQPLVEALERPLAAGAIGLAALAPGHAAELHRLFPWLAGPPEAHAPGAEDPELARYRLFEALRAAVATLAARGPVLLLLDDLHWATAPTAALLLHLVRSLEGPVLVVGTYRDAPADLAGRPFEPGLVELLRRPETTVRTLAPLDEAAVAALVAQTGAADPSALARRLHRQTAGNPLFVAELLRDLTERRALDLPQDAPIPPAVRGVIEQRLERLGEPALAVLRTAAVAGERFAVADVEEASDLGSDAVLDALESALAARVLREHGAAGGEYAFAHGLVADTLRSGMSATRIVRLHARLADVVAARGGAPTAVARHLLAAGSAAPAAELALWAERAVAEQLAALAYEEAAALAEQAVDAALAVEPAARARLLLGRGDALDRSGAGEDARAAYRSAAAQARTAGDPELLARAALGHRGLGVTITAPDPGTIALLEEALAGGVGDGLRARLLGALALEHCYEDGARGVALGDEALALAREVGDPATLADTLTARHALLWSAPGAAERLDVAAEILALARAAGDPVAVLQARHWQVLDLLELAHVDDAVDEIERYAREAAGLRLPRFAWYASLWRAAVAMLRGAFAEAERHSADAQELARGTDDPNAELHLWIQRLQLRYEQERFDEIDVDGVEAAARRSPAGPGAWLGWLAVVCAGRGEEERARAFHAELVADDLAALPGGPNWHAACEAAESCATLGDAAAAATVAERLRPFADLNPVVARGIACYGPAGYYAALAAETAGRTAEAAALYERALAACERMGATVRAARIRARMAGLAGAA